MESVSHAVGLVKGAEGVGADVMEMKNSHIR